MNKLQINETVFDSIKGKQVSIEVNRAGFTAHKLGPITFLGMGKQKLTEMVNAPEKRTKDGKSYTPVMFTLMFENDSRLVFVEEDTKVVVKSDGVRLILDNLYVDVVEYSHELHNH
jgi:hypothetical protein